MVRIDTSEEARALPVIESSRLELFSQSESVNTDTGGVMDMDGSTLDEVREVIVETLGIQDRARILSAESRLFGSVPELDSFGVLELAAALETRFRFEIDESDFTAEIFETVGTLALFVERNKHKRCAD